MFTRLGGVSDPRFKATLTRGERIRAVLAQTRFSPMRQADQVALLAALNAGVLDAIEPEAIAALRPRIGSVLDASADDLVAAIEANEKLDDAALERLVDLVRSLTGTGHG